MQCTLMTMIYFASAEQESLSCLICKLCGRTLSNGVQKQRWKTLLKPISMMNLMQFKKFTLMAITRLIS